MENQLKNMLGLGGGGNGGALAAMMGLGAQPKLDE